MPKIFLCYRREDSACHAHLIYRDLSDYFGTESVVFDVDTIPLGSDYREFLNKEVSECDILLAIIGDQWLDILSKRLRDKKDWVRIEILAALGRKIPVVPIIVGRASIPEEKNLPSKLAKLAHMQAAEVRAGPGLENQLKQLINKLDRLIAISRVEKNLRHKEAEEKDKPTKAEVKHRAKKKNTHKEEIASEAVPKKFANNIGMEFVLIPAGNFMMGCILSPKELAKKFEDGATYFTYELPQHKVTIRKPFYLQSINHRNVDSLMHS